MSIVNSAGRKKDQHPGEPEDVVVALLKGMLTV
jgi:hypothetical protein